MDNKDREEIISEDIKDLLIAMHKGVSIPITLTKIMDIMKGIHYMDKKQCVYLLRGLMQYKMEGKPTLAEEKAFFNGHNEAVEENNFAVKLAIDVIIGDENA